MARDPGPDDGREEGYTESMSELTSDVIANAGGHRQAAEMQYRDERGGEGSRRGHGFMRGRRLVAKSGWQDHMHGWYHRATGMNAVNEVARGLWDMWLRELADWQLKVAERLDQHAGVMRGLQEQITEVREWQESDSLRLDAALTALGHPDDTALVRMLERVLTLAAAQDAQKGAGWWEAFKRGLAEDRTDGTKRPADDV
jgi:hypothetical protein